MTAEGDKVAEYHRIAQCVNKLTDLGESWADITFNVMRILDQSHPARKPGGELYEERSIG